MFFYLLHTFTAPSSQAEVLFDETVSGYVELDEVQCHHFPEIGLPAFPSPERWKFTTSSRALLSEAPLGLGQGRFIPLSIADKDGKRDPQALISGCDDLARWKAQSEEGRLPVDIRRTVHSVVYDAADGCSVLLIDTVEADLGGGLFLSSGDITRLRDSPGPCVEARLEGSLSGEGVFFLPLSLECREDRDGVRLYMEHYGASSSSSATQLAAVDELRSSQRFATEQLCGAEKERMLALTGGHRPNTFPIEQTVSRTVRTLQQATPQGAAPVTAETIQVDWSVVAHGIPFVGQANVDLGRVEP